MFCDRTIGIREMMSAPHYTVDAFEFPARASSWRERRKIRAAFKAGSIMAHVLMGEPYEPIEHLLSHVDLTTGHFCSFDGVYWSATHNQVASTLHGVDLYGDVLVCDKRTIRGAIAIEEDPRIVFEYIETSGYDRTLLTFEKFGSDYNVWTSSDPAVDVLLKLRFG